MAQARCSDEDFIELWNKHKSSTKLAKILEVDVRNILRRRKFLEKKYNIKLIAKEKASIRLTIPENKVRTNLSIEDGLIIVGSDCHYWPGYVSTAHRAFVHLVKKLKPHGIVLNGDIMDNATISQHNRIGWDKSPTVKEELEEVQARLGDIEAVRPAGAFLHRTIGNHDLRFDGKLSNVLGQYEGVPGMALADHLPGWTYSWSLMVNNTCMIKHRWHNGQHGVFNNTLKSGVSMVTGHLHSLKVTPWSDYTGDRYGVDTGTMSAIGGDKYIYTEDSPVNWRSGFAVLTFRDGQLMPPELVQVISEDDGLVFFRGEMIEV
jgi:hypothetical protein